MKTKCEVCGLDFSVKPSRAREGKGRFCSWKCRRAHGDDWGRRLWRLVDKTDSCWIWKGSLTPEGYGRLFVGRGKRTIVLTHRLAYELVRGPIPKGLHLDHLCRDRRCVNPDHLEAVTCRTNILRGVGEAAKNRAKTHCKNGHPLFGDNLVLRTAASGQPARGCRICNRLKAERHRLKKKGL